MKKLFNCLFLIIITLLSGCIEPMETVDNEEILLKTGVSVNIDRGGFERMLLDRSNQELEEKITLTIGSKKIDGILKLHGGTSRSYPKKSMKIYLDKGIESKYLFDSEFIRDPEYKVKKIILNAATIDFSRSRNWLSMYTTQKLGGVVPQIGYSKLYINDEYYGLYSLIEKVDDDFVESNFHTTSYDLLKARGWQSDLFHGDSCFELKEGSTHSAIHMTYHLEHKLSYDDLKSVADMSSMNSYYLGNTYSDDIDSYGKNYYFLYDYKTQKFQFIRWDADATFGRSWDGAVRSSGQTLEQTKVRNAIFKSLAKCEDWREDVSSLMLEEFEDGFTADLLDKVNMLEKKLTPLIIEDYERWFEEVSSDLTKRNLLHWDFSAPYEEIIRNQFAELRTYITEKEPLFTKDLKKFAPDDDDDDDDDDDKEHKEKD